ncbi:hypothetical protein [Nonomuraea sp. SYSU D8015]|uniref:hypothetical protein n=1 Tax=Nonomuraea sp. SYSU D8015 TaxID=2593644 RepID=UPI001660771B|nr:hypothetical protein [Nonomuraea sp. SYSU D8015]
MFTGISNTQDLFGQPSRALIASAVPRGMRRAGSQNAWLRTLKEDPEVLELRCDGFSNLMLVANVICWHADWSTMCSRPTVHRIVERTGLAKPTVKRWVRWLRERGWLGTVEQGSTCRFRKNTCAGLVDDGFGNRAAVWVLCVPRRTAADRRSNHTQDHGVDQQECRSDPPSASSRSEEAIDPTRAGERRRRSREHSRISPTWHLHRTPRTKRDRLAACERLRRESPVYRLMTPWYLRWLLKIFLDAGATPADLLHGLDVRDDGSHWTYTWKSIREIRHPAGWVMHRLSAWIGPNGQVLPLPSQRRAAADARRRAEQEARRREWEATAQAAGYVPGLGPATDAVENEADLEDPAATPAGPATGPNEAFRAARAEMERRCQEKAALEEEMIAEWRVQRARRVS